jgi:hypothetical protein
MRCNARFPRLEGDSLVAHHRRASVEILIKASYMAVLRKALNIAVRVLFRSGSLDGHLDWWERPTHDKEWVYC